MAMAMGIGMAMAMWVGMAMALAIMKVTPSTWQFWRDGDVSDTFHIAIHLYNAGIAVSRRV